MDIQAWRRITQPTKNRNAEPSATRGSMKMPTREELLYIAGRINDLAHKGIRHLERHGAPTIPQDMQ